jgi:hypothetical protein
MRWNHAQVSSRPIPGGLCPLRKLRSLFRPDRAARPRTFAETPRPGWLTTSSSSGQPRPFVRRLLSPTGGRALEILGHAIEYLADEYANDLADKGPLGSADPRVAAMQILKELNRVIYYSGTVVEPVFGRMKRWLLGSGIVG